MIIWFTGLSGSGKTTLSDRLKKELKKLGYSVYQVDGDIFREERKSRNSFTKEEILKNNYQIISYCQSIFSKYDFIIVSVISPFEETRRKAKETFGKDYLEIFLSCPLEELIKRDPKKLYSKALSGKIENLIGFSKENPYEIPKNHDLVINTLKESVNGALDKIISLIKIKTNL